MPLWGKLVNMESDGERAEGIEKEDVVRILSFSAFCFFRPGSISAAKYLTERTQSVKSRYTKIMNDF